MFDKAKELLLIFLYSGAVYSNETSFRVVSSNKLSQQP
jgi:hypothetical protein